MNSLIEINHDTIGKIVAKVMLSLKDKVSHDQLKLSSEKSLCFYFAWELGKTIANDNYKVDFESHPFLDSDTTDRDLDLLVYTDEQYKVAFEFKFPRKGIQDNSNSDQTNTRKKIYRDIARLSYLVRNNVNNIKAGFFICIVNEEAYINIGRYSGKFKTYHNFAYSPNNTESRIDNIYGLQFPMSSFNFKWDGIKPKEYKTKPKGTPKLLIDGKVAWLDPIRFFNH